MMTTEDERESDAGGVRGDARTGEVPIARDNTRQSRLRTAGIALLLVAVCVGVGAWADAKAGTLMLAGVAFGGAAARMLWPAGTSFSVRRRFFDVGLMIAFAVALTYLGLSTPLD